MCDAAYAALKAQLSSRSARLLWRHSGRFAFYEFSEGAGRLRAGYSNSTRAFYAYREPTESMADVQASMELFEQPPEVLDAVRDAVRIGSARLVEERGSKYRVYGVEHDGKTVLVGYWVRTEQIEVYQPRGSQSLLIDRLR